MNNNDSDYEAGDDPGGLLEGFEQLARELDAQRYPGPAQFVRPTRHAGMTSRDAGPIRRTRPRGRQAVAAWRTWIGIAIAAGIGFAAIVLGLAAKPPAARLPAAVASKSLAVDRLPVQDRVRAAASVADLGNAPVPDDQATSGDAFAEGGNPQVVIVEDLDSYSLIDMSGKTPVVSYMSKDAASMDNPVPVPLGLQVAQDTSRPML